MKKYVKPTTETVVYDHDIADAACGVTGNWETSYASGSFYKLCAHFPYQPMKRGTLTCTRSEGLFHRHNDDCYEMVPNGKAYYTNRSSTKTTRMVKIEGHHIINFIVPTSSSTLDCGAGLDGSGYRTGCGWQIYDSSAGNNNGSCHFFGEIEVDGFKITQTGSLPTGCSDWN